MNELMIYVCGHKNFEFPDNIDKNYHKKLLTSDCNNDLNDLEFCYAEGYHIYNLYINKDNLPYYIGISQYRNYFDCNCSDILNKLKTNEYDIVLPESLKFPISIYEQYNTYHNKNDINLIIEIILELYPEYSQSLLTTFSSKSFYERNMFIMSKDNFIKYCEWVFNILSQFNNVQNFHTTQDVMNYVSNHKEDYKNVNININNYFSTIDYSARIQGFLMERLFNVYITHNFKKILECKKLELSR